jgi:hypothetical protein
MPRYFFHVIDGRFIVDRDGTQLADLQAARVMAIQTAGEMIQDAGREFWDGTEWQMHVTDEGQKTVLKLSFSAKEMD